MTDKLKGALSKGANLAGDMAEKLLSHQNGRTGRAAHRVARMVENKVDKDVIGDVSENGK